MRRLAVLIALVCAAPASASDLLVVGRSDTLYGPNPVTAATQRVTVGKRRCAVGARTPLAALLDSRLKLSVRDYGACSKRAVDAGGLYVRGIAGERERGRDGWVYKIGHRTPSTGAADLASRTKGRVLWFWCRMGKKGCQRTLDVAPAQDTAAPEDALRVRVRAYDDLGKEVPAAGATVTVGDDDGSAVADAGGIATVTLGSQTGTLDVVATQTHLVRSFSEPVTVR